MYVKLNKWSTFYTYTPSVINAVVLTISKQFVVLGIPLPAPSREDRACNWKKGKQRDRRPSGNSKGKGKGGRGGTPGKKKPFYKDKKKVYAVTLK